MFRRRTSIVSPFIPVMATGPKPPFVTGVRMLSAVRKFVIVDDTASFAVPSGRDMNTSADALAALPSVAESVMPCGSDSTSPAEIALETFSGAVAGASWQLPASTVDARAIEMADFLDTVDRGLSSAARMRTAQ